MPEQQWEFCMLYLDGSEEHKKGILGMGVAGWGYDCGVTFSGSDGSVFFEQISTFKETLKWNPFPVVMGKLGGYGWELVSAQHATSTAAAGGYQTVTGYLSWERKVAYFRRAVVPGRAVNDARLK